MFSRPEARAIATLSLTSASDGRGMTNRDESRAMDRRSFLTQLAVSGAALAAVGCSHGALLAGGANVAPTPLALRERIGLQLFTVRDLTATDYPGTLMRVSQLGYRMVQTTGSYGTNSAQQIHEWLERAKLTSPATHVSPRVGPDFERTLEGYQLIGHKYTTVSFGPQPPRTPPADATIANPAAARGAARRETLDTVKRTAAQLNAAGAITKKHGIKVIVHNHTEEFEPLADSAQRPYDVLLAETDPSLVAMELDIGWAAVAGESAIDLFHRAPGRFEVWHVKDVAGLASLDKNASQAARHRAAKIVPVGEGDIDYRPIFAQAALAGMKYAFVEQDSAPASGDSLRDAGKSYGALMKVLG
jgi:sugar phosphate isomerase/epimerase